MDRLTSEKYVKTKVKNVNKVMVNSKVAIIELNSVIIINLGH